MGLGARRLRWGQLQALPPALTWKNWLARPPPQAPWGSHGKTSHLAEVRVQDEPSQGTSTLLALSSSKTQIRRLQMVPLTDCSQEPCQMHLSWGSVKLGDDSGKVSLKFPITANRTAQLTAPLPTLFHQDEILWGVEEKHG